MSVSGEIIKDVALVGIGGAIGFGVACKFYNNDPKDFTDEIQKRGTDEYNKCKDYVSSKFPGKSEEKTEEENPADEAVVPEPATGEEEVVAEAEVKESNPDEPKPAHFTTVPEQ